MAANRQLKINLIKDQNNYLRNIQKILSELEKADPASSLLSIEKAIASRALIKKLWDFLPDEYNSYKFNSVDEQTICAVHLLPMTDFRQTVVLHLGWDVLSFSCSLEAAWQVWKEFNTINTETFNCCIYPEDLKWYIIRAGINLYPMMLVNDEYKMKTKQN